MLFLKPTSLNEIRNNNGVNKIAVWRKDMANTIKKTAKIYFRLKAKAIESTIGVIAKRSVAKV
ncbi:MAG: hypothetical protein Kapaf2KO_23280 [Candidatus Kapaibacteriales bacterium]